jgi:DNA polymerase-1
VELKHGHRRGGHLNNNMIINTPIQGTAFHCLLWSYIKLNEIRKRQKWKSEMLGQIHDELIFGLHPREKMRVMRIAKRVMTKDIAEEHDWLIVPLEVGMEITEVDKSWYTKKGVKYER